MKRLLLLISFSLAAFAQSNDFLCVATPVTLTAPGTVQFDNRGPGCDSWTVYYVADSGATLDLEFESASGQSSPGSWSTYPGNTSNASTNFGTDPVGIETLCGLATCVPSAGVTVATPWVRVNVDTLSGGTLRVFFYGYRTGYGSGLGGGGGGGGGGGCTAPCVVIGPDAPGAAPTQDPVESSGFDGTNVRRILTDSSGRQIAVGGAASGAVQSGNPVPVAGNDGTDVRTLSTDTAGVVNVNVKSSVAPIGRASFSSGQAAVTGTAANLGTNTSKSVCVEAFIANTITVYAGAAGVTTSSGIPLNPGQGYCWDVANTNLVFVVASTTGASVGWSLTN